MLNEIKKYRTDNIQKSCISLLTDYNKLIILDHTKRVSEKSITLANKYNINADRIQTAAYLHDISGAIPRSEYANICFDNNINIIEVEKQLPILLHQKVSMIIAKEIFNVEDNDILSAIACHTTLKSKPSKFDMVLFISDKLEWDQNGIPPYKNAVENALNDSLESASLAYINYIIDNKMVLIPHPSLLSAQKYLQDLLSKQMHNYK